MADAVAGAGIGIGGIGGLISSLNAPDAAAELSPEIQAKLKREGIDITEFSANMDAVQQAYGRKVDQYKLQTGQMSQEAFNKIYGGTEGAAGTYAQSAFEGKTTPGAINQISELGVQSGHQGQGLEQQILQDAAARGIPANSPIIQEQLARAREATQSAFLSGSGQIRTQDYSNSVRNAFDILNSARSGRIAGTQNPAVPLAPTPGRNPLNPYPGYSGVVPSAFGTKVLGDRNPLPPSSQPVLYQVWNPESSQYETSSNPQRYNINSMHPPIPITPSGNYTPSSQKQYGTGSAFPVGTGARI